MVGVSAVSTSNYTKAENEESVEDEYTRYLVAVPFNYLMTCNATSICSLVRLIGTGRGVCI